MKKMKKIIALALSLVMLMAMGMTAFAGELGGGEGTPGAETTPAPSPEGPSGSGTTDGNGNTTYTLTIANPVEGHSYEVYQIYTGDVFAKEDGTGVLSNIKYGANYGTEGTALTANELAALQVETNGMELAKRLSGAVTGTAFTTLSTTTSTTQVPGGYYLIKDVWAGGNAPTDAEFSDFMISIVGATTFMPKTIKEPTFEKTSENLEIVSNKKVGDPVPFQLKATLPLDFGSIAVDGNGGETTSAAAYKLIFHDELSAGLTYKPDSIVVKVDGSQVTPTVMPAFEGQTLTYTIDNVFGWCGLTKENAAGAEITIEYEATINNTAITRTGETNKATLEYTNGPSNQTGVTPEETVRVLLTQLVVSKVDGTDAPLAGAGFTLYEYDKNQPDLSAYTGEDFLQRPTATVPEGGAKANVFIFGGLKEGDYVLVESTTPDGYNTMEPVKVSITFTRDTTTGEPTAITVTSAAPSNLNWTASLSDTDTDGKYEGGSASASIVNQSGIELPSTGGIGTTIFYVIGGIMVLGACVLLVTKKRMKSRG